MKTLGWIENPKGDFPTFITPKISGSTVRHAINSIIIDHHRTKNFCGGIHESRSSKINLLDCPNASHACLHGETTIMPAMLIGAYLIQEIEGKLSFNHPGVLFWLMTQVDISAQRLFMRKIDGYDSTEAALLTSDIPEERYSVIAQNAREWIILQQEKLYREKIRPYTSRFIEEVQRVIGDKLQKN